tara:strand:+ start:3091 stop:3270 length:180 start_codon:yes stop_codon:yes gene_type:complete
MILRTNNLNLACRKIKTSLFAITPKHWLPLQFAYCSVEAAAGNSHYNPYRWQQTEKTTI